MDYAKALQQFKNFMQDVRREKGNIGLEPEFTVIETFVLKEGPEKMVFFRENLDRFFSGMGRGLEVLEKLGQKAAQKKLDMVVQGLSEMGAEINNLFSGQFLYYPSDKFAYLPQSEMLRKMSEIMNKGDTDALERYVVANLSELEGHFFLILGASSRNARAAGEEFTVQFYNVLGAFVARKRLEAGLPCSFARYYGVNMHGK